MLDFLKHLSDKILGRRELMAYALSFAAVYGFLMTDKIDGKDFVGLLIIVYGFYFNQRAAEQRSNNGRS